MSHARTGAAPGMTDPTGGPDRAWLAELLAMRDRRAEPQAPFVIEHREALTYMLCYEDDDLRPHRGTAWTLLEERVRDHWTVCAAVAKTSPTDLVRAMHGTCAVSAHPALSLSRRPSRARRVWVSRGDPRDASWRAGPGGGRWTGRPRSDTRPDPACSSGSPLG